MFQKEPRCLIDANERINAASHECSKKRQDIVERYDKLCSEIDKYLPSEFHRKRRELLDEIEEVHNIVDNEIRRYIRLRDLYVKRLRNNMTR